MPSYNQTINAGNGDNQIAVALYGKISIHAIAFIFLMPMIDITL
ncbi:hypothetical protein [Nostoc flagelliforme]|nr:hypothetical protein [Nostoc flagelliforme]